MPDRLFSDSKLADLYDLLAPWGEPDDMFYIDLVMAAESVLDVGCGTGLLLREARKAGHTGRLCGLDPADAMLEVARESSEIEWVSGDLTKVSWESEFDLIVMTGHAFQVFLTGEQLRFALGAIRKALVIDGRFAFETRNPADQAWERRTPETVTKIVTPDGASVYFSCEVHTPIDGDLVSFTSTFTSPDWGLPRLSRSTLRFLDAEALTRFLFDAGFKIDAQFGDWDRSQLNEYSPEITTIARRA